MNKYTFDKSRPLSWSSISSFEYSREQWFDTYLLGKRQESAALSFGSYVDKKLQDDPTFLPDVVRLPLLQHKMSVMFGTIPLVGIADGFDREGRKLLDYKTGKKPWDKKRADETGQLTMYCLLLYVSEKIKPEEMDLSIVWFPTQEHGDFSVSFVEPIRVHTFPTKRTMRQVLAFGMKINKIYREMEEFVKAHQ
jgi:hypothetical protein